MNDNEPEDQGDWAPGAPAFTVTWRDRCALCLLGVAVLVMLGAEVLGLRDLYRLAF
jgi:hypothetical protein